jgi:uncharacterized membrane protein
MNPIPLGILLAFLVGLSPIAHKMAFASLSPNTVLLVCTTIYFICILAYTTYHRKTLTLELHRFTFKTVACLFVISVVSSFLVYIMYVQAIQKHQTYTISALMSMAPLFTAIMAFFVLKEKITLYGVLGIILIICGVALMAFNNRKISQVG